MDIKNIGMRESVTALLGQEQRLNQLANNLANVDTTGYKKEGVAFRQELIKARNGTQHIGTTMTVTTDHKQAAMELTGNPLDLAISGKGYFKVQTPHGIRYTRAGNFQRNSLGELITPDGDPVLGLDGKVLIKGKQVTIGMDGRVNVDGQEVTRLAVVTFADPRFLAKEGKNYFRLDNGGQETPATNFAVQQGFIEKSNVNSISEMSSMMELLRLFETQQRVVRTIDDIDSQAVTRVGKLTP